MKVTQSQRCLKVGEEIKRALAGYFQRGDYYALPPQATMLTVTEVQMSADLQLAKVYILPLGGGDEQKILGWLKEETPSIRSYLGKQVYLKFNPKLAFRMDDTFSAADQVNEILKTARVKKDLDET